MVCVVKPEYQVSYDKTLVNNFYFKNLRINLRYLLCGPPRSKGEGLFYRIIHGDHETCIQCIFFYKRQWIPYHTHDYHPFYIYLDKNHSVKHLIIDDGHHFSKLLPIQRKRDQKAINITILLPDHGLTNLLNKLSKIFQPKLIPLLPDQIQKWWQLNNMAQLKLRTKLIDPWAPGLVPDKPPKKESLLYRINHIIPVKLFPSSENNFKYTFRDEAFCPNCKRMDTLDFMSFSHDKVTGKSVLRKKMMCKKKHQYLIKYDFESGKIEYETKI